MGKCCSGQNGIVIRITFYYYITFSVLGNVESGKKFIIIQVTYSTRLRRYNNSVFGAKYFQVNERNKEKLVFINIVHCILAHLRVPAQGQKHASSSK